MAAGPVLVRALNRSRISPALREQIMLAVTSVNDCRYCNWGHTALALRNGVDLAALRQTLGSGSLSADSTPDEVAILYAQHVASEQGDADPGAERALAATWAPAEQAEIKAYITAITVGVGVEPYVRRDECPRLRDFGLLETPALAGEECA